MHQRIRLIVKGTSNHWHAGDANHGYSMLMAAGIASRNQQAANSTLELRKIPREDNTIANINDHFSKFGIIVNLQVGSVVPPFIPPECRITIKHEITCQIFHHDLL